MQTITESWEGHLGETEIHIGGSDLLGFWQWLSPNELGGSGMEISVGPSLNVGFGHIWNEKVVEGFGVLSLST